MLTDPGQSGSLIGRSKETPRCTRLLGGAKEAHRRSTQSRAGGAERTRESHLSASDFSDKAGEGTRARQQRPKTEMGEERQRRERAATGAGPR